jgi:hypothetical protein
MEADMHHVQQECSTPNVFFRSSAIHKHPARMSVIPIRPLLLEVALRVVPRRAEHERAREQHLDVLVRPVLRRQRLQEHDDPLRAGASAPPHACERGRVQTWKSISCRRALHCTRNAAHTYR